MNSTNLQETLLKLQKENPERFKQIQESLEIFRKSHTPWIKASHVNRNDLCYCGSGKKVKKCCGIRDEYYLKS